MDKFWSFIAGVIVGLVLAGVLTVSGIVSWFFTYIINPLGHGIASLPIFQ